MLSSDGDGWHPRNQHQGKYDFEQLIRVCPKLDKYVFINKFGSQTIDFFNAEAVKLLNEALLKKYYRIEWWDIPKGFLCPPIPGRAEYIHRVAELVQSSYNNQPRCLDIGVGANCIYPIIGSVEYNWYFVGVDCDETALVSAQKIIDNNQVVKNTIELRKQPNSRQIFKQIIAEHEYFDLTICNPPFHSSLEEANQGALRKVRNLRNKKIQQPSLNFGGQQNELWCEGGERKFIETMIIESKGFAKNVHWFTTLVSKAENINYFLRLLTKMQALEVKVIDMNMGNKMSRILCWKFEIKN
jgi:23S rRNA (adenine1618-N6)-methyltransferase